MPYRSHRPIRPLRGTRPIAATARATWTPISRLSSDRCNASVPGVLPTFPFRLPCSVGRLYYGVILIASSSERLAKASAGIAPARDAGVVVQAFRAGRATGTAIPSHVTAPAPGQILTLLMKLYIHPAD